jgi:hypothetical protein
VHAVAVTDVGPSATVASLDEQELPLVMLDSPYRAVVAPLARYRAAAAPHPAPSAQGS